MNVSINGGTVQIGPYHIEFRGGQPVINGRVHVPADGSATASATPASAALTLDRDGTIRGDLPQDLHLHGENITVTIAGHVRGSLTHHGSGPVTVQRDVGGSLKAGMGVSVGRDVGGSLQAGSVTVGGSIGGSVQAGNLQRTGGPR